MTDYKQVHVSKEAPLEVPFMDLEIKVFKEDDFTLTLGDVNYLLRNVYGYLEGIPFLGFVRASEANSLGNEDLPMDVLGIGSIVVVQYSASTNEATAIYGTNVNEEFVLARQYWNNIEISDVVRKELLEIQGEWGAPNSIGLESFFNPEYLRFLCP